MSIYVYHLLLWLYKTGIRMVSPWNPKAALWIKGRENLFSTMETALEGNLSPIVWMHCDAIGEFEQGLPVLEKLRLQYPGHKIVVTFFSPSGYETRKNHPAAEYIFYLPADSRKNAEEFIRLINPRLVLWVKSGCWLFYLQELKKKNIPVLLISGVFMDDQPWFKGYGKIHRSMLSCFTWIFVQNEAAQKLLESIAISENVSVSGDTRFDRVIEIADQFEPVALIEAFCGTDHPVIVAGSTWEEDEEELDHYANAHPEIKFIIAPHQIDEESLRETKKLFKRSIFFSEWKTSPEKNLTVNVSSPNVLIIDNIGMLVQLYKYATIAYVGGGFVDGGVHNVLEAAVYGKPVVFGPVIEQYIEALDLVDCGGGLVIDSALEAEETFNRLLTNPEAYFACCGAAKNYVYSKKGATEKILVHIQEKRLLTN